MAAKIVLKQTTKMSLSDRFGSLRSTNSTYAGSSGGLVSQNIAQQRAASIKNRKLAQQMERRPTVIAALKLKKKSLQNRLGNTVGNPRNSRSSDRSNARASIQSRLSLNSRTQKGSFRGSNRRINQRGRNNPKSNLRGVQQGGVNARKGISPLLKGRLGAGGSFANRRGGGQKTKLNRASFAAMAQTKKKTQRGVRGGANKRNQQQNQRQRGRGRGRGRGRQSSSVSRQDLDNDIDAYMAKTKSSMDMDLDELMI